MSCQHEGRVVWIRESIFKKEPVIYCDKCKKLIKVEFKEDE